jgi:hypothetical protein
MDVDGVGQDRAALADGDVESAVVALTNEDLLLVVFAREAFEDCLLIP